MSERFGWRHWSWRGSRCALIVLVLLVSSNLACGMGGVAARRNNNIRRVVVAYELAQRGPADELMVAFGFMEVRANLGFTTGNTVWLQPVAVEEYWEYRDPDASYIYLHRPEIEGDTALVIVDRGNGVVEHSYRLTLRREGAAWSVTEDVCLTT